MNTRVTKLSVNVVAARPPPTCTFATRFSRELIRRPLTRGVSSPQVMLAASAAERRGWDAAATVRPPGGRARPNSSEAFAAWLDETYVSAAAVDARVAALAARLQRHVGVAARAAATQALAAADAASAAATASQHGGTALDGGYSDQVTTAGREGRWRLGGYSALNIPLETVTDIACVCLCPPRDRH